MSLFQVNAGFKTLMNESANKKPKANKPKNVAFNPF